MKTEELISEEKMDELWDKFYKCKQSEFSEYPVFVSNLFKKDENPMTMILHASMGLSGECGELIDSVKKTWVYEKELNVENIIEELGDIRFYYQAMLNILGLDDALIRAHNVDKLKKRYPTGQYSNKDAIKRADKQ